MSEKSTNTSRYAHNQLKQELKARHITMIALGGSIGTGLFIASGTMIATAGPGGALLAYLIIGLMVYFLMTSLGELAAYLPVSGPFYTYGSLYVDESFGFALGWNYWYNWAVTIAVDLVAAQIVMEYWFPYYSWIWSILFLFIIVMLNYISVKGFGEAEYWFSLIKIMTIIIFIIISFLMLLGIVAGYEQTYWHNWQIGEAPFVGGIYAIIRVAMIVGFSFQGTELIGIAAGESQDPRNNIPKAVRQVCWRIILFYVLTIFLISLIIPYMDSRLLRNSISDISMSPFTLILENAGLLSAAAIMNAVILITVLSVGNSGMYAATRMLYTLAKEGKAPQIFARLSAGGVPRYALIATTVVATLCFFSSMFGNQVMYLWLLNLSGMTGFIAWLGIAISHYRFRKGYLLQGHDLNKLPYRSKFFPIGSIFAFILCLIITLGQNYQVLCSEKINWYDFMTTYISIFVFLAIWLVYKLIKKTHIIKYKDMYFPDK